MAFLTIERQVTDLLGELSRRGQVAGRDRRLGGHLVRVEQLEPAAERLPPQRGQQLGPAQGAGRRRGDVAVGELAAGLQVQRGALADRVAGPAGQRDTALGQLGARRVQAGTLVPRGDDHPRLRGRVARSASVSSA